MHNVRCLVLGDYQVNCYILWGQGSKVCCVIDPGYQSSVILDKLEQLGLELEAILLTHGHFDHVGAVGDLVAATDCRVYLCQEDLIMPPAMTAGKLYYTDLYQDGDVLNLAGVEVTVLHTPGHTPGSVCLLAGDILFSGDTLFAESCGRTDLPCGDPAQLWQSLAKLSQLTQNLWVLPGHGESTTLSDEKRYNPYLRKASL